MIAQYSRVGTRSDRPARQAHRRERCPQVMPDDGHELLLQLPGCARLGRGRLSSNPRLFGGPSCLVGSPVGLADPAAHDRAHHRHDEEAREPVGLHRVLDAELETYPRQDDETHRAEGAGQHRGGDRAGEPAEHHCQQRNRVGQARERALERAHHDQRGRRDSKCEEVAPLARAPRRHTATGEPEPNRAPLRSGLSTRP